MPRNRAAQRFDRWAPRYDRSALQNAFFVPVQQAALDSALATDRQPARILDVGCGTGRLLARAAGVFPGAALVGVDPAPRMVREASASHGEAARFLCAAAERLPLADGSFDLVMSTVSFHHWDDHRAGLREIARVLRPGGTLVLTDIFLGTWWLGPAFLLLSLHGRFVWAIELDRLLAGAGFRWVRRVAVPGMAGWVIVVTARLGGPGVEGPVPG